MKPRLRGRVGRVVPRAERLEDRVVLAASVSIDAVGMLTLDLDRGINPWVEISLANDGYHFNSSGPITVATNAAGLPVDGTATKELRVEGITGITIVGSLDGLVVALVSADVPTTIHARVDTARVTLGGDYGTLGLQAITAPVIFDATYDENGLSSIVDLKLMDRGSRVPTDYTITADGITATGGFGGVSYRGLDSVELFGTSGDARFDVRGVIAGRTLLSTSGPTSVFDVDADMGPDERAEMSEFDKKVYEATGTYFDVHPALGLIGGYETSIFNVKRTPTWMSVESRGVSLMNITRDGSTAEITHDLLLGSDHGGIWRGDVVIDDSAGTEAREAHYQTSSHDVFDKLNSSFSTVRTSALTGAAGGGEIHIAGKQTGSVTYKAPRGLANALTIDLGGYSPLPSESSLKTFDVGAFSYDGGYTGAGDPETTLALVGVTAFWGWSYENSYISEVHAANDPGSGSIVYTFETTGDGAIIQRRRILYDGLSPAGLSDLATVGDYRFDYRGATDPGVVVTAGPPTADGLQTMRIASQATIPAFIGTTLANKARVTIDTHGSGEAYSTVVDYGAEAPVAGLSALTVVTNPEDQVNVATPPPGATVLVDRTTTLRVKPDEEPDDGEGQVTEEGGEQTSGESAGTSTTPPSETPTAPTAVSDPSTEQEAGPGSQPTDVPPQVVGGDRAALFGAAMRPHVGVSSSPRFRNLHSVREAQLQILRMKRRERLHTLRASLIEARQNLGSSPRPWFQPPMKSARD